MKKSLIEFGIAVFIIALTKVLVLGGADDPNNEISTIKFWNVSNETTIIAFGIVLGFLWGPERPRDPTLKAALAKFEARAKQLAPSAERWRLFASVLPFVVLIVSQFLTVVLPRIVVGYSLAWGVVIADLFGFAAVAVAGFAKR